MTHQSLLKSPLGEDRRDSLMKWYAQNFKKKILDASVAAQSGNIPTMETALILARAYSERSDQPLNETEIKQIEQVEYIKALSKKFPWEKDAYPKR